MAVSDIVVTVGTTGRQYSTLAAAEAAIPTDLAAVEEWNISSKSGTFTLDEGLSFSPSGATGTYLEDDGSTMLFEVLTGTVTSSDTVTGDSSTETADIDTNVHQDGASWKADCYNDSEFTITAEVLFNGTSGTSSTRTVTVTAAAGESFIDHADVLTNALKYDASKGVAFRRTTNYQGIIQFDYQWVRCSRIQGRHDNGGSATSGISITSNSIIRDCISGGKGSAGFTIDTSTAKIINCLCIAELVTDGFLLVNGADAYNCTAVMPDDLTASGDGFEVIYGPSEALNCASFGFVNGFNGSYSSSPSSGHNATDDTTAPGADNQVSKTFADQFENVDDATQDWRAKDGDLDGNGTRDEGNTDDLDIVGQARSTSAPTIGCWEFIVSITTATGAQALPSFAQAGVGLMHSDGAAAQLLANPLQAGVGAERFTSIGAQLLANLLQAGVGLMHSDGAAAQLLANLLQAGVGEQTFTATGVQLLENLLQAGAGTGGSPAISQITLDADGTIAGEVRHDAGTGTPFFTHCNDAPDGLSSDFVENDDSENTTTAWFSLTDVDADFSSMDTLNIDVDVAATGFSNDSCTLTARIFDADNDITNPLTAETGNLATDADSTRTQRNVVFATLTGTKAQWDAAHIRFTWTYNQTGGPDNANIQLFGCDIDGTFTSSGHTGAGAQALADLLQAGVGLMHPDGDGVQTLADLLQAGVGEEKFTSTGAQLLANPLQSGVGLEHPDGAGAQLLAQLLQAGVGLSRFTGTGTQLLANPLQSGIGLMHPDGAGAQLLANLLQAGTGAATLVFTATGTQLLANPLQAGVGLEHPNGTGAQLLADLLQAGVGEEKIIGTGTQALANLLQAGVGLEHPDGTGAQFLANLLQAGTGVARFAGTGAQLLANLLQAGVGLEHPDGAGAQTLAQLLQAGTGTSTITVTSTGAQLLANLLQAGVGLEHPDGTGAQLLANPLQAGTGIERFLGTGNQLLANLLQAGVGVQVFKGAGAQALQDFLQLGVGLEHPDGAGAQLLATLLQTGAGTQVTDAPSGVGAQLLQALNQLGLAITISQVSGFIIVQLAAGTSVRYTTDVDVRQSGDVIIRQSGDVGV